MFEPVEGLPAVLSGLYVALNDRKIARALEYIDPDATLVIETGPGTTAAAEGYTGFERWMREAMSLDSMAVAPISATFDGALIVVQIAITALRASGESIVMVQQVDYRIENGLIVAAHVWLPRRRR